MILELTKFHTLLDDYLNLSDSYMFSMFMCMDNAHSAEKMYVWQNIGDNNKAWKSGPYISAPANEKPISRDYPYCLRISKDTSLLAGYLFSESNEEHCNKGKPAGNFNDYLKATTIIPITAVCTQFMLLERYEFAAFNLYVELNKPLKTKDIRRYNKKPVKERMNCLESLMGITIPEHIIEAYKQMSDLRNKLTHEISLYDKPYEANGSFIIMQGLANYLNTIYAGNASNISKVIQRNETWEKLLGLYK